MSGRLQVRTELVMLLDAARAGVERAQRRGQQQPGDPDPLAGLWSETLSLLSGLRTLLSPPADTAHTGEPDSPSSGRPERIEIS